MHEAGHGFGLEHVISSTNGFLMRPERQRASTGLSLMTFWDFIGTMGSVRKREWQQHLSKRYRFGNLTVAQRSQ